jgi:hypothetical protein
MTLQLTQHTCLWYFWTTSLRTESFLKPFGLQDLRNFLCPIFSFLGCDEELSVFEKLPQKLMSWRWPSQNTFGMWTVLNWTRSSRREFGVSINVRRFAGDTSKITCKFVYSNHQMHSVFLIILYIFSFFAKSVTISQHSRKKMQKVVSSVFIPCGLKQVRILKVILQYKHIRKDNMHIVGRVLWIGEKSVLF